MNRGKVAILAWVVVFLIARPLRNCAASTMESSAQPMSANQGAVIAKDSAEAGLTSDIRGNDRQDNAAQLGRFVGPPHPIESLDAHQSSDAHASGASTRETPHNGSTPEASGSSEPLVSTKPAIRPTTSKDGAVIARRSDDSMAVSRGPFSLPDASSWYRSGPASLVIVLVLVIGTWQAAKRWLPRSIGGESPVLKVVARASISPRHQAALLQLNRRFILVGVSGDRLCTLSEISDEREAADLLIRFQGQVDSRKDGFSHILGEESATFFQESASSLREGADALSEPKVGQGEDLDPAGRNSARDLLRRLRSLRKTLSASDKAP